MFSSFVMHSKSKSKAIHWQGCCYHICRFYPIFFYQIANTLGSICIFSSQDDGWGLHTQRCDKAPTFANFKSSKATFVESNFLVLVLVDKDGGICSCWENKESPHISMVLKCTGEVTLTSRSTPPPQLFTFEALQFHLTVKCTSTPTLLLEYIRKGIFLQNIAHLEFSQPSSISYFSILLFAAINKVFCIFIFGVFAALNSVFFLLELAWMQ